jgi:hypothetical protein
MMTRQMFHATLLLLVSAPCILAADTVQVESLRQAVPRHVYLAVASRHNPERDYQKAYFQEVWDTFRETRLVQRAFAIATSRMSDEDRAGVKSVIDQVRNAATPIDFEAVLDCKESVYAQTMQVEPGPMVRPPAAQHLALLRMTPAAAAANAEGVKNLFQLIEKAAKGAISIETDSIGDVDLTVLVLPPQAPYQPTVAAVGDVLLLSTSKAFARESLAMLTGAKKGESKFDDPRLKEALGHLPPPEDNLVFFDGQALHQQLRGLGQFLRTVSGGDPNVGRAAKLVERIIDELLVFDYEVTSEYTEDHRNCTAAYGKLVSEAEGKLLTKVLSGGQPFDNWQVWVPADAISYSLGRGANLHPIYEWIVDVIPAQFPEAAPAFEQFEQLQSQWDVHVDRDILQALSGEFVSVSLPSQDSMRPGSHESVLALRCHKPDRIRTLLHRLLETLEQHPVVKAQQLKMVPCEDLDGFEQLSSNVFALLGIQPVIGFRDGWMVLGSSPSAVERVLDAKAGKAETIAAAESFKQFHLQIDGPVDAVSYQNLAEQTRHAARLINQVGQIAPVIFGLVGAQNDEPWVQQVQDLLGLLPDVAKVVAKFDFYEAKMSVTQPGDSPGTYRRQAVTLVRPPAE